MGRHGRCWPRSPPGGFSCVPWPDAVHALLLLTLFPPPSVPAGVGNSHHPSDVNSVRTALLRFTLSAVHGPR